MARKRFTVEEAEQGAHCERPGSHIWVKCQGLSEFMSDTGPTGSQN